MFHLITTLLLLNLFKLRSKNDKSFIRGLRRNDWVTEICEVMLDFNDKETCSSWLMSYLGNKNEDEFVTTTVKLGCPMLTKKMDNITAAAAMWQESDIFLTSQRIILSYLSNFFDSQLIVPEHCVDKLGQNYSSM